jgi:tetratricopeptide (TPR) repeat protein
MLPRPSAKIALLVSIPLLLIALSWRGLVRSVYNNASACYLSHGLLREPADRDWLDKSLALCIRALDLQPSSAPAARRLLRILVEKRLPPTSLPPEASRAGAGGDALSTFHLGELMWHSGENQRAIELWRSVENSQYYFMNLGHRAHGTGDRTSARDYYQLSNAIDDEISRRKHKMYINMCEYGKFGPDFAQALSWCSRAVDVSRNVGSLLYLGNVYFWMRDYDAALSVFEEARDLDDGFANVYYYLGRVYHARRDLAAARSNYEQGLALSPSAPHLNLYAGDVYFKTGELDKAFCCFMRVLEHSTNQTLRSSAERRLEWLPDLRPTPYCGG